MDLTKLYPPVQYPVSRGTPMISPLVKWDHQDMFSPGFDCSDWYEKKSILINTSDKDYEFVLGHVIDGELKAGIPRNFFHHFLDSTGKVLLPGTCLIVMVWETFAMLHGMRHEELPVVFEDVQFKRATSLMKNQDVILSISFHKSKEKAT